MLKKIISFILALTLLFMLTACGDDGCGHAELSIDLPSDYERIDIESFDSAYRNTTSVVGIIRISFAAGYNNGIPDTLMPSEFAQFYMKKTGKDAVIQKHGDVAYYEYSAVVEDLKQSYIASFYRSPYAYFTVIFACPEPLYEEIKPSFLAYTQTVHFED